MLFCCQYKVEFYIVPSFSINLRRARCTSTERQATLLHTIFIREKLVHQQKLIRTNLQSINTASAADAR